MLFQSVRHGDETKPRFERHNKDRYSWVLENSRTNIHGVGILVNKTWRKRINWTDCINERAIATSITVNKKRVLLMSVYFSHSEYADHHVKRACRSSEKITKSTKKRIQIVGGRLQR